MSGRRDGFTLVELLAVIACAALLAALLLPNLMRARQGALAAKCESNLRQLAAACIMYGGDHDGLLIPICAGTPPGADSQTWRALAGPYLGVSTNAASWNVFYCPAAPKGVALTSDSMLHGQAPRCYGVNKTITLHLYPGTAGARATAVLHPASTVMMTDIGLVQNPTAAPTAWKENVLGSNYGYVRFPSDAGFGSDAWDPFPRHRGRANVAFYDGHVSSVDVAADLVAHPPGDPRCLYDNH